MPYTTVGDNLTTTLAISNEYWQDRLHWNFAQKFGIKLVKLKRLRLNWHPYYMFMTVWVIFPIKRREAILSGVFQSVWTGGLVWAYHGHCWSNFSKCEMNKPRYFLTRPSATWGLFQNVEWHMFIFFVTQFHVYLVFYQFTLGSWASNWLTLLPSLKFGFR